MGRVRDANGALHMTTARRHGTNAAAPSRARKGRKGAEEVVFTSVR